MHKYKYNNTCTMKYLEYVHRLNDNWPLVTQGRKHTGNFLGSREVHEDWI